MSTLEKPLISIITRAYNVEDYIGECAESVLSQTYENFEWIVLENGSTDNTGIILEMYAKKDKRIRLFVNRKNYNKIEPSREGEYNYLDLLKKSKGKYVTELDSDDFLHRDYLKALYEATGGEEIDIVAAGSVQFFSDNPHQISNIVVPKAFSDKNINELGNSIDDFYNVFRPVWGKIILRDFYVQNLDYIYDRPSYISIGGDTYVCLRILQVAKSCVCIDKPLYFYRVRNNSITRTSYYKDRYLSYDAIFFEGNRLLKIWEKSTQANFEKLSIIHLGGLEIDLKMISNVEGLLLKDRLEYIENLLQDKVYREYIGVFSNDIKVMWEHKIHAGLEKIYNISTKESMQEKTQLLFYKYNFSQCFISKKLIFEKKNNKYDMMLYIIASISEKNTVARDNELVNFCIKYLLGENCTSILDARRIIEQHTKTEKREYDLKIKMNELLSKGAYDEVEKILETLEETMRLDCDVLFSRACCCYARGDVKNTVVLLTTANELYPEEEVIQENLNNILEEL
ncbi:glycosyltransferase family 2 protein [Roseburia sp. 499]|uniref:glycosyltransferase family 2 protein n=1 Tax=Roseburia sp. 499 TaxID=1261634 RepID=UPI000951A9D4|nr:glycosyltransferase family 2 protein [Roseburia sp. 499]WVK70040.1 glycosyltransferase family 2 protein [Roseburia sp. 499]